MVRKKFMRHCVPLAAPSSTLNRPSGMRTLETQVCAARSSVVLAVRLSVKGSVMKKWSKGAPCFELKLKQKKKQKKRWKRKNCESIDQL